MGVTFEEEKFQSSATYTKKHKGIAGQIVRLGLAKNNQQATIIMIAIILVMFAVTFFLLSEKNEEVPRLDPSFDPETGLPFDTSAMNYPDDKHTGYRPWTT